MTVRSDEAAVVRTRFAPSPTGYLHLGGARTALFNYLLARRAGGQFLLRIEDTDQTRNLADAEAKLLEDLRWLGLHWDEGPEVGGPCGPYHQSQRLEAYRQHARRLLEKGRAYYASDTREELEALRAEARRAKRNFRYPRPARFPSESEAKKARAEGRPVVLRFKMPERGFVVKDRILGDVTVGADELDDFVLLKADGWPTYHFAVVIDDEHMKITHVLRGQEHLINTPRHIALQEAFGYRTPEYAHLPIILNLDGSKMSKREKDRAVRAAVQAALRSGQLDEPQARELAGGPDADTFAAWLANKTQLDGPALRRLADELTIELPEIEIHDFRVSGYLPEVIVNFLALLGWSPGDGREKLTLEELCAWFSLERIGKTNARFDRTKLLAFNTDALAAAPLGRKLAAFHDYLSANERSPLRALDDATLSRLLEINKGLRIFRDIDHKCGALFLPDRQVRYDPEAVQKVLRKGEGEGLRVLRQMRDELAGLAAWNPRIIESKLKAFCEAHGLGMNKVAQPIRVAVTGTTISPPIFDTLDLLGRERTLARIDRVLARHGAA